MSERFGSSAFVGREFELSQLLTIWEDAFSGRGRLLMLVGEPGIGKTRLAEELHEAIAARGGVVLWGRCHEQSGAPPYWPWVQVFRSYFTQVDAEQLLEEMGTEAASIAQVVPGLSDKLPDIELTVPEDPEQARFRFFDSVTTFLKTASSRQPLVIILDNLHWADASSLRLLEFLAQGLSESHLLVLGTYRDVEVSWGQSLFHTLGDLSRQRLFYRVPLKGLDLGEVRQLIEQTAGVEVPDGLVSMIHQQTAGNPFFTGEMVRLLAQEDMLTVESPGDLKSWDFRLPEGVREVIGRRLAGLSDECRGLLTQASVVGREFGLALLANLSSFPEDRALELLEEALREGIIGELPREVDRFQFTHALIQQTLAAEISAARRVRLHARIGDTLEMLYAHEIEEHAPELAYHFSEAEGILGPEKGIKYSRLAGERALAAYAYEDAISHFKQALSLSEGEIAQADMASLLYGLGRAEAAILRIDDAMGHLEQAFNIYVEAGDVGGMVSVASVPFTGSRGQESRASMIERALGMVPAASTEAGWLLCLYGRYLTLGRGDVDGAWRSCQKALAIGERTGDKHLQLRALNISANVADFHLRRRESNEMGLRGAKLAAEIDSPWDASLVYMAAADAERAEGRLEAAKAYLEKGLSAAKRLRDRERLSTIYLNWVASALWEGDWSSARAFSDESLGWWPYDTRVMTLRVIAECESGNLEDARSYLNHIIDIGEESGLGPPLTVTKGRLAVAASQLALASGDRSPIETVRQAARAVISSRGVMPFTIATARMGMGIAAVIEGDGRAAQEQLEFFDRYDKQLVVVCTTLGRLLGLLAKTIGRIDRAVEEFAHAREFCAKARFRPELAWVSHDYAETLLQRNGPGDRDVALSLVQESINIAEGLGMKPLHERAVALLEQAKSMPMRGPVYPAGLTEREVEVLRLIAAGKTDREIAAELIISIRTVGNHVSNILNKTSSVNRTEATAFAVRHGLV